jgi:hypothetical protein
VVMQTRIYRKPATYSPFFCRWKIRAFPVDGDSMPHKRAAVCSIERLGDVMDGKHIS